VNKEEKIRSGNAGEKGEVTKKGKKKGKVPPEIAQGFGRKIGCLKRIESQVNEQLERETWGDFDEVRGRGPSHKDSARGETSWAHDWGGPNGGKTAAK